MHLYLNNLLMTLPRNFVLSLQRNNPLYSERGSVAFNVEVSPNTLEGRTLLAGATHAQGHTPRLVVPFRLCIPEAGLQALTGTATLTDVDDSGARFKLEADRVGLAFAAGTESEDIEAVAGSEKYLDELSYDTNTLRTADYLATTTHARTIPYPSCYVGTDDESGLSPDSGSVAYMLQTEGEYQGLRCRIKGDGGAADLETRTQMRFPYVVEQVLLKATGYPLPPAQNAMRFHPAHSRLFMVNARDTVDLKYMLPHWTVLDFLSELRRMFGLVISFNGTTFTAAYINTANGASTFYQDATASLQDLQPDLPRSYEVNDSGEDEDGFSFTEQQDPTCANVGYDFLTDANAREILPEYILDAAQVWNNQVSPREWYATSHDGLGAYEDAGAVPYVDERTESLRTVKRNTNGLQAIPMNSNETIPYRTIEMQPTGTPVPAVKQYSVAGQPPVTTYGRYIGNGDIPAEPTNLVITQVECDYLAPMYRHDRAARKTDYNLRITPAKVVLMKGDRIATQNDTNPTPVILTDISTDGDFFEITRTGIPTLYPYIEETEEIVNTDPNGAELDNYQKPTPPDGIEVFVV